MKWYWKVLKNYVGFTGRARRKEYWMFCLVNFSINLLLLLIMVVGLLAGLEPRQDNMLIVILVAYILDIIYNLAVFLPMLAVNVRRLHDIDHSGWWLLLKLIPLAGPLTLIIFSCVDSTPGANRYGENPKTENQS